jgi:probable HAF family extracellular repeat protein/parallel beta-helix repeat protein
MKTQLITFFVCFIIISNVTSYGQPISFSVFEISIPGGTIISLNSINDSGYVAGVMRVGGTDYNIIYDFKEVTTLPFLSGYERAGAGIYLNKNRQAGGTYSSTTNSDSRGFLFQNGNITNVGTLGGPNMIITGINNSGAMSGYTGIGNSFPYHAIIYENGKLKDLGTLSHDFSRGIDINNLGHVTGWSNVVAGQNNIYHAFLYKNGQMLDLGTLGGDIVSIGGAVNDSDYVVGVSENYLATPQTSRAFVWYGGGSMESLPLFGSTTVSTAFDINNNNFIIGRCNNNSISVPVIWIDGQVYNINNLVDPGYSVSELKAINNNNQILCSNYSSGTYRWFILNPKKGEFIVNVTGDESDFDLSDEVADVDPDIPGDQTTLRAAIEQANHNTGKDKIIFNIPGNTEPKILIQSPLPSLTSEIEIDGTTQIGSKVEISGLNAGAGTNGFLIQANNCVIKGLVINSFSGSGILIQNGNNNKVWGNVIGTDKNSSLEKGNGGNGITIINGANNIVGGTTNTDVNVIAGNSGSGISIKGISASGNQIISNYIGTDTLGTESLGNAISGIELINAGTNNMIGSGLEKSAFLKSATQTTMFGIGNIITKSINAIKVENTLETKIVGNVVGLFKKPASEIYLPNGSLQEGIKIINSKSTVISSLVLGAAGGDGIRITGPESKFNKIFDAYIGSDPNGTEGLGNMGSGILIDSMASENKLGGCDSLIMLVSNTKYALEVINSIQNKINGISAGVIKNLGTSRSISKKSAININLGNLLGGMKFLDASENVIGDSCARNIIAANKGPGMIFEGSSTNLNKIFANLIGTDEAGSENLGNDGDGMIFMNGANNNTIGSENPGDANISVSNKGNGFTFLNTEANTMQGSLSGVFGQINGILKKLGNQNSGVLIKDSKDMHIHQGFFGGNQNGIRISGEESVANKLSKIFAGTDGFASLNLGNSKFGILLESLANNNVIGGLGKDSTVVVGGNKEAGLYLKLANQNKIFNTLSGIMQKQNETQMSVIKNLGSGVVLENSEKNQFGSPEMPNMVAANNGSGLVITGYQSIANKILSSLIGTDSTGRAGLGNLMEGILVNAGASNNFIGGENSGEGVMTVDNGNSGIKISGQATKGNEIQNTVSGIFQKLGQVSTALGNSFGLVIEDAPETTVKNSTFAANTKDGGVITGLHAASNKIFKCLFGTDSLLQLNLGNLRHGLSILNGANLNTIGGEGQNYFSGNKEWGLTINAADNNQISNNIIGGLNSLSNSIENLIGGIKIENSTGNVLGRSAGEPYGLMKDIGNMVEGHDSAGVAIINSPGTKVIGNEIIKNKVGMLVKMDSLLINVFNKMHIMNNSVIQNLRAFEGTNTEVYIAGNQISENTGLATGIHLFNSTGKITGNMIADDAGDGIALENGSNPVITKNNIIGNKGFGVRNFDSSSMVDATQNWWGNANGPSASGPGSGDKVSTGIDFTGWKTSMIQFTAFAEEDTFFVLSGSKDTLDIFLANFQADPGMVSVQFSDDLNWISGQTQSNLEFTNNESGAVLPLFVNVPQGVEPNSTNKIIISSNAKTGTGFSASDTFYLSVYQPMLVSLNITPDTAYVNTGETWQFSAIGLDQENNSYAINAQWEASGGVIDNSGMFTAGTNLGTYYVKVTDPETQLTDSAVIIISKSTSVDFTETHEFILYQNFPNPFSDRTTIKYSIPFESRVSIRIYTMNGTVVKQFSEAQPSGIHLLEWDVSALPAGIYFYSIEVNEINGSHSFRDVKKMSVMQK